MSDVRCQMSDIWFPTPPCPLWLRGQLSRAPAEFSFPGVLLSPIQVRLSIHFSRGSVAWYEFCSPPAAAILASTIISAKTLPATSDGASACLAAFLLAC